MDNECKYLKVEEEMDWMNFRADCMEYARKKEEALIKKWLDKIGYNETIGYYRDIRNHTMEIYTQHPGVLIGKYGKDVHEFQDMLDEEYRGHWKVKFIEVRGGFMRR